MSSVALLPVTTSFTIEEGLVILINIIISIIDPPKDVHVDGTLFSTAKTEQKNRILTMIARLFVPDFDGFKRSDKQAGITELKGFLNKHLKNGKGDTFRPIKDQKAFIDEYMVEKGINVSALEYIPVLRLKHSSAHDPRLSGLYVSFDNAYKDVVSDPIFIITGGTLVDPSSRQTSGKNVKYVITHDSNDASDKSHLYDSLPFEYIRQLGMNTCIKRDENVTVNYQGNGNGWKVIVPVTFGDPIEGVFDNKCVPETDEFKGNETKNIALQTLIKTDNDNALITGMRYILIKEIGDTFQVMWLKHIFEQEEAKKAAEPKFTARYDTSNTVITSSDYVVLYRSVVNGIPVIHSIQDGTSKYYLPLAFSKDIKEKIIRDGIEKIALETISHNKQVADTIAKVAEEGQAKINSSSGSGAGILWINGIEWKRIQIANCAMMLLAISFQIRIVNMILYEWAEEQKKQVTVDTKIGNIQAQISQLHSKNPFIKKKEYYYTINSVTVLLPVVDEINSTAVTCVAAKMTPHYYNPLKSTRGGTRESQKAIFDDALTQKEAADTEEAVKAEENAKAASASASASADEVTDEELAEVVQSGWRVAVESAEKAVKAVNKKYITFKPDNVLPQVLAESGEATTFAKAAREQQALSVATPYAFTTETTPRKVHIKTSMEDSYNIILGDYDAPNEWAINVGYRSPVVVDSTGQYNIDVQYPKIVGDSNRYEDNPAPENDTVHNKAPGLLHGRHKSPFLFFYVRAFHPEIFTYANCMNIGMNYDNPKLEIKDYETLLEQSELNKDHYQFSGDGSFLYYIRTETDVVDEYVDDDDKKEEAKDRKEDRTTETEIYGTYNKRTGVHSDTVEEENKLRMDTVRAIKYTRYLIKAYPHLATKSLKSFLNQFSFKPFYHVMKMPNSKIPENAVPHAEISAAQLGNLPRLPRLPRLPQEQQEQQEHRQGGGGELTDEEIEERLPAALQIAMDVYEIVYSWKIKANYLHIDYLDLIEDRLENIIRYNNLIRELQYDTSTDKELIKMLEYERVVFQYDLQTLPGGPEILQEYTNQLTSESHTESTNEFNSVYGNVRENIKPKIPISSGGRFRKTRRNRKVKKLKKAYTKSRRALKKQSRKNK